MNISATNRKNVQWDATKKNKTPHGKCEALFVEEKRKKERSRFMDNAEAFLLGGSPPHGNDGESNGRGGFIRLQVYCSRQLL